MLKCKKVRSYHYQLSRLFEFKLGLNESSNITDHLCEPMNYGKQKEGGLSEAVSIPKTTPTYFFFKFQPKNLL